MEKIRLSPSGKVLGDAGPGLQLRLATACTSCATLAVTTGVAPLEAAAVGESLVVSLAGPKPTLLYRAHAHFTASKINETTGQLEKRLQVRYTVAGTAGAWSPLAQNLWNGIQDELGEKLQALDTAMELGSDLLTAMPDDCELIEVRVAAAADGVNVFEIPNGGAGNNQPVYVELVEYYNPLTLDE